MLSLVQGQYWGDVSPSFQMKSVCMFALKKKNQYLKFRHFIQFETINKITNSELGCFKAQNNYF